MTTICCVVPLMLAAAAWAQDAPPAPAPAVPQAAPAGPGAANAPNAQAVGQALEQRMKAYGLTKEQGRQLLQMLEPLRASQRELQTQLQSLMAMVGNEQTSDADLTAALQAYEQLRDKAKAERDDVKKQVVEKLGDKPRLQVLLLAMGLTDDGLRGGGMVGGGMGGARGRWFGGGGQRGRRGAGGGAPAAP